MPKVEPVIWLLCGLVVLFTVALFASAVFLQSDGQTFQVVSGLVTSFAGALMMRVKPRSSGDDHVQPVPPESGSVKVEVKRTETASADPNALPQAKD